LAGFYLVGKFTSDLMAMVDNGRSSIFAIVGNDISFYQKTIGSQWRDIHTHHISGYSLWGMEHSYCIIFTQNK
jgi:hypothetical protein